MPFVTPTLAELRRQARDDIAAHLPGADASPPNSNMRVLGDSTAGLAYLQFLYLEWLSRQIMVDTAEGDWLDRFARIWLPAGRKPASFAEGEALVTGSGGSIVPSGARLRSATGVEFETLAEITLLAGTPTPVSIRSIQGGAASNLDHGTPLSFVSVHSGVNAQASVAPPGTAGGADEEDDELLRARVISRIQQPPHGGSASDYVAWALEVPGVTRAWSAGQEMGIGTVSLRFMMDELRADAGGIPTQTDVEAVAAYIDPLRPVAVRDLFVAAPVPHPMNVTINDLVDDRPSTRGAIETQLRRLIASRAAPGQTIYRSWVAEAVSVAAGEDRHDLIFDNLVMPSAGHIAVLGNIIYG